MTTCPGCGRATGEQDRFCPACGHSLPPPVHHGVRKRVTLLFTDIQGSTALGESSDPEVIRAAMERYFHEMEAVIVGHGGTVEKFIGDAVMAAFGIPTVREDDALLAVRA